ncbi:MAG TPA: hypothetical protein VK982_07980 [Bacteroidales bacterium]|nr:hypothetical protein [Bacteroidales bacterium]
MKKAIKDFLKGFKKVFKEYQPDFYILLFKLIMFVIMVILLISVININENNHKEISDKVVELYEKTSKRYKTVGQDKTFF